MIACLRFSVNSPVSSEVLTMSLKIGKNASK